MTPDEQRALAIECGYADLPTVEVMVLEEVIHQAGINGIVIDMIEARK